VYKIHGVIINYNSMTECYVAVSVCILSTIPASKIQASFCIVPTLCCIHKLSAALAGVHLINHRWRGGAWPKDFCRKLTLPIQATCWKQRRCIIIGLRVRCQPAYLAL